MHLQQVIAFNLDSVGLVLYFHGGVYCRKNVLLHLRYLCWLLLAASEMKRGVIMLIYMGRSSCMAHHQWNIWITPSDHQHIPLTADTARSQVKNWESLPISFVEGFSCQILTKTFNSSSLGGSYTFILQALSLNNNYVHVYLQLLLCTWMH